MKGGCKASPRGLDDILISPRLKESIIASGALLFCSTSHLPAFEEHVRSWARGTTMGQEEKQKCMHA